MSALNAISCRRQGTLAALIVLTLLTSAGCASVPSSSPRTRINVALAQQRSAELTAANAYYEATLRSAAQEHDAGRLSDDGVAAVRAAGTSTHSALVQASAELNLYLSGGGNGEALSAAFTRLAQSRRNLSVAWDAAQREIEKAAAAARSGLPAEPVVTSPQEGSSDGKQSGA